MPLLPIDAVDYSQACGPTPDVQPYGVLVGCVFDFIPGSQAVIRLTLQSYTASNNTLTAELVWFDDNGAQVSDLSGGNNTAQTWLNVVSAQQQALRGC